MTPALETYLEELRELRSAPLLGLLARGIASLDPEVQPEIVSFGMRFRLRNQTLCELSVFEDLFIARVGPSGAVEFRVRDEVVALRALDAVLIEYARCKATARPLWE